MRWPPPVRSATTTPTSTTSRRSTGAAVVLLAGGGRAFKRHVCELAASFARISEAADRRAIQTERNRIESETEAEVQAITRPFEEDLRAAGLTMVQQTQGHADGDRPAPGGSGPDCGVPGGAARSGPGDRRGDRGLDRGAQRVRQASRRDLPRRPGEARGVRQADATRDRGDGSRPARGQTGPIRRVHDTAAVESFLDDLVEDVLRTWASAPRRLQPHLHVRRQHRARGRAHGSLARRGRDDAVTGQAARLGRDRVDAAGTGARGLPVTSAQGRSCADGGYLVMEARTSTDPAAATVARTPGRASSRSPGAAAQGCATIKPDHPASFRVIAGDATTFHLLDRGDPESQPLQDPRRLRPRDLRSQGGVAMYGAVVARIAAQEKLPAFDRTPWSPWPSTARASPRGATSSPRASLASPTSPVRRPSSPADATLAGGPRRGRDGDGAAHQGRANLASRRFLDDRGRDDRHRDGGAPSARSTVSPSSRRGCSPTDSPRASPRPSPATPASSTSRAAARSPVRSTPRLPHPRRLLRLLHADHALAFSASLAFEQSYGGIDGSARG